MSDKFVPEIGFQYDEPNPPTPEPTLDCYMYMPGESGPPEIVDPGASLEATGASDERAVRQQRYHDSLPHRKVPSWIR